MKKLQERKLSMMLVVLTGLQSTIQVIIDLIPKYHFYVDGLADFIKAIETTREKQEQNTKGTTELKAVLKRNLVDTTLTISRKITAFAVDAEESELKELVNYSKSKLTLSPDTILRDRCQVIHTAAVANLEYLGKYGVTKPLLERLQKDIEKFKFHIPSPRLKITTKKDATDDLTILFEESDKHLKKMDQVFEMTRDDHFEFYRNYKNNRILINPATHMSSVSGIIKDIKSNPVANVVITEPQTGLRITSRPKGTFKIKKMEPGNYIFTFSKNGFTKQTLKVAVNENENTELTLILIPE